MIRYILLAFGMLIMANLCLSIQTSFSSSEVTHLSAWAGLAITMVFVSPNDRVLRVTFGEVLAGEAGADA